MADQQEQFSYEEYKTYKRVAKILTEEGGETESQGSSEYIKNKSESDDPGEAYRERQRKLHEEREQKRSSITDEQLKEADRILDRIIW
ncbi:hypothetical protein [Dyadobacter sp. 676]|uniref:Uncharacterized protein n=1 Tax=Dyadobacter sp. 676 TaxID=3088362 RepID=A0AAU8FQ21_9BACT